MGIFSQPPVLTAPLVPGKWDPDILFKSGSKSSGLRKDSLKFLALAWFPSLASSTDLGFYIF